MIQKPPVPYEGSRRLFGLKKMDVFLIFDGLTGDVSP